MNEKLWQTVLAAAIGAAVSYVVLQALKRR